MKKSHKKQKMVVTSSYLTVLGILMMFILLDAFIQGSKDQLFLKFFLSIFTIPLVIGMIGYGTDYERFKDLSFKDWLKTYFLRQIIFYVLAVVIYTFFIYIAHIEIRGFSTYMRHYYPRYVLRHFYDAFFRLSFLIAIIFYQLFLWIWIKLKLKIKTYLVTVSVVSLISLVILLLPQTFQVELGVIYVFIFEKNLMFYNMIFFALGAYLRHVVFNQDRFSQRIMTRNLTYTFFFLLMTSLFFILNRSDLYLDSSQSTKSWILSVQTVLIYLLNIIIMIQLALLLKRNAIKEISFFKRMGELYQGIIIWYGALIILAFQLTQADILTSNYTLFYVYISMFASIMLTFMYVTRNNEKLSYYLYLKAPFHEEALG